MSKITEMGSDGLQGTSMKGRKIWSDETKKDGLISCSGPVLQDHHVKATTKYGGGSLMF